MRGWLVAVRRLVVRSDLLCTRVYVRVPPLLIAALLAFAGLSSAQASAGLRGTATDETGAVIAGATIAIRQTSTNLERHAKTNSAGRYQVAALDVGSYRIAVRASGFRTQVVADLRLEVGRTSVQDFVLSVGDVAEEVAVTAGATRADRATL